MPKHAAKFEAILSGKIKIKPVYHYSLPKLRTAVFQETAAEKLPNMRINIPKNGLLLTSAIKSEGGDGFSAIEFPHVKPAGASQHHHSMIEDALFPPPCRVWLENGCPRPGMGCC